MFCTRCGRSVPDFIWINNDHPVLVENSAVIVNRNDNITNNTTRITCSVKVERRMCSELYQVSRS